MTATLIAQLEALSQHKQRSAWDCANCGVEANLVEAVSDALRTATARAEALERENERLREALAPFAETSKQMDEEALERGFALSDDAYKPRTTFRFSDLRRARQALEAK